MSGIIGHTMYAMLGAKAAAHRRLPVSAIIERNFASYLAGSYLGSDIQTLPAAVCEDTGKKVGYGSLIPEVSPITGGKVKPWKLAFKGTEYTPREIHRLFYGRSHLVFGWPKGAIAHAIPWESVPGYVADAIDDAIELSGPGHRKIAYILGWSTHVVGDSLIKSVRPGITLNLLDGKYTPRNRPVQDLITFNEVGKRELGLDWSSLLADLTATPVESIQPHYMRVAEKGGRLGAHFPNGWIPEHKGLLNMVMAENRSYQRMRNPRIIEQLTLKEEPGKPPQCDPALSETAGGLTYSEMIDAAEKSDFRNALWHMGERVAGLFEQVVERSEYLQRLPEEEPDWESLTRRWRRR